MTERARRLWRLGPLLLVIALAVAWQVPDVGWLDLAAPDAEVAERMTAALDALGEEPRVLVGFDADIGTYAETRPTVRAMLADLLARDARLAFVSLTAEGRALASAELARLDRVEANPARLLDLGFIPGAEAGLVDLTRRIRVSYEGDHAFAREVEATGIGTFDAVLVIGGNDLGPRSWIEQVAPASRRFRSSPSRRPSCFRRFNRTLALARSRRSSARREMARRTGRRLPSATSSA